jgi:hypothetical protein
MAWANFRAVAESRPRVLYSCQTHSSSQNINHLYSPVIPRSHWRLSKHHLSNANTLSLTTRDTTDKVIADLGVVRMAQATHCHDDLGGILDYFFTSFSKAELFGVGGETACSSELEGLADREMREVLIDLFTIVSKCQSGLMGCIPLGYNQSRP